MGIAVTQWSLGGEMDRTLAWNARDVGSIPALGATRMTLDVPSLHFESVGDESARVTCHVQKCLAVKDNFTEMRLTSAPRYPS